jgi:hypothetical protein
MAALPIRILMANLGQDGQSYLLVYLGDDGETYEIYLPAAGYPGPFKYFMTPSIREQSSGVCRKLPWPEAETLAHRLRSQVTSGIARGGDSSAASCLDALIDGKRCGDPGGNNSPVGVLDLNATGEPATPPSQIRIGSRSEVP